jgi:hypothetical protein
MSRRSTGVPLDPPDEENSPGRSAPGGARVVASTTSLSSTSPRIMPATASSRHDSSSSSSSGDISNNPLLLTKMILRKFMRIVKSDHIAVIVMKDILMGVIAGAIIVTIIIALDYRGIIRVKSAERLRNQMTAAVADPAFIASLEEEMEVKFMDVNEYNEKQQELNNVTPLLEKKKAELTSKTEELEKLRMEVDPLKKEYDRLVNDPKNPIKLWCGDCNWPRGGPKKSCDSRLEFMMDTYGVAVIEGKIAIMKDGRCKKSE